MKIAVIGVGGVGGYFGGKLAQKNDVTFIARGETLEAMKSNGLKVDSINGIFEINPVQVTDRYEDVGVVDLVLVCVKSQQVAGLIEPMKPLVGENTLILPMLNGVDAISQFRNEYGSNVIGGFCRIISFKVAPGVINHASSTPMVDIGEVEGPISPRIERVYQLFEEVEVKIFKHNDFLTPQWGKMIFICVTSGIGAITRSTFGEYRDIPEVRGMVRQAIEEGKSIARSCGANLPDQYTDGILKAIDSLAFDGTTSMQRDIQNGNPSEIDFLLGALVRIAKENNVVAPLTEYMYYSLLPQELRARKKTKVHDNR